MPSPISTIRQGRSYYPSKQFASASADIDPHEWTGLVEPGQVVVFGAGGIGGAWIEEANPYGGTQDVPSGYTARNVVILNVSDPFSDNFLFFGKSVHDVVDGPSRAIATSRGPCYSQGEYDQFVVYNASAVDITLSAQWDHAGTPASTNAGHPGHGHVSMQLDGYLAVGGAHPLHPAWKRSRRVTAVHLYSKSGVLTAGATLAMKVDNVAVGSTIPLTGIATETLVNIPVGPVELTNSSVLQLIVNSPAQAAGTDLVVELEYEFI